MFSTIKRRLVKRMLIGEVLKRQPWNRVTRIGDIRSRQQKFPVIFSCLFCIFLQIVAFCKRNNAARICCSETIFYRLIKNTARKGGIVIKGIICYTNAD